MLILWGYAIGAVVIGTIAAFAMDEMKSRWFREVCSRPDPLVILLDFDKERGVEIGSNELKASHLDHKDHPLSPLRHYRPLAMALRD